jgi:hypothetical protein
MILGIVNQDYEDSILACDFPQVLSNVYTDKNSANIAVITSNGDLKG